MLFWSPRPSAVAVFCVALLALLASIRAEDKMEHFTITQEEFCEGCDSFIDLFYKHTKARLKVHEQNVFEFTPLNVVDNFCKKPPFSDYKDGLVRACMKIAAENLTGAIEPFLGTHDASFLNSESRIYQHKTDFCIRIKACQPPALEPPKRSRCNVCKTVVQNVHRTLSRWKQPPRASELAGQVEKACVDIGLRYLRPTAMEEACGEMAVDYADSLPSVFLKKKSKALVDSDAAFESLCVKRAKRCRTKDEL